MDYIPIPVSYYKYIQSMPHRLLGFYKLAETMRTIDTLNINTKTQLIKKLEKEIYTYSNCFVKNVHTYNSTLIDILSYFNNKECNILQKYIDGTLKCKQITTQLVHELDNNFFKEIVKKVNISKSVEFTENTSRLYTCPKCKATDCIFKTAYNRSMDEGTGISVVCKNCGKVFRG